MCCIVCLPLRYTHIVTVHSAGRAASPTYIPSPYLIPPTGFANGSAVQNSGIVATCGHWSYYSNTCPAPGSGWAWWKYGLSIGLPVLILVIAALYCTRIYRLRQRDATTARLLARRQRLAREQEGDAADRARLLRARGEDPEETPPMAPYEWPLPHARQQ